MDHYLQIVSIQKIRHILKVAAHVFFRLIVYMEFSIMSRTWETNFPKFASSFWWCYNFYKYPTTLQTKQLERRNCRNSSLVFFSNITTLLIKFSIGTSLYQPRIWKFLLVYAYIKPAHTYVSTSTPQHYIPMSHFIWDRGNFLMVAHHYCPNMT